MRWQKASATSCSAAPSWPRGPAGSARRFRRRLPPLEHSFAPGIDISDPQRREKYHHDNENRSAQLGRQQGFLGWQISDLRPRIEKQQFDVKDEKENGDQVELHIEALPGST